MSVALTTKQRFQIWAILWVLAITIDTTVLTLAGKGYIPLWVAPLAVLVVQSTRGTLTLYILGPVGVNGFKNADPAWQDVIIVSTALIVVLFLYGLNHKYGTSLTFGDEPVEVRLHKEGVRIESEFQKIEESFKEEERRTARDIELYKKKLSNAQP